MSSRITFIDNNIDSGDWCVVILNGEVIHEGIGMTDDEIQNWREVLYGEE